MVRCVNFESGFRPLLVLGQGCLSVARRCAAFRMKADTALTHNAQNVSTTYLILLRDNAIEIVVLQRDCARFRYGWLHISVFYSELMMLHKQRYYQFQ